MKSVLFRVDASEKLGMGHLSRCLSLAKRLKNLGARPYFLLKENSKATQLIAEAGFQFFTFKGDTQELSTISSLHRQIKFRCMIMDLRQNKSKKFFINIKRISKVAVIGNNTHKNIFYADLVILPEIKEQYPKRIVEQGSENILIGTKYSLLRLEGAKRRSRQQRSILISMGGTDKNNFTERLVRAFMKTTGKFHANIVIGRFSKNGQKIAEIVGSDRRFSMIRNANTLLPLLMSSQIGILTMGVVTYEALFAGLPSLILSHSRENDLAAKRLATYDCFQYLGYHRSIDFDKIPRLAFSLMNNSKLMERYSSNSRNLVDGRGLERVARKIMDLIS